MTMKTTGGTERSGTQIYILFGTRIMQTSVTDSSQLLVHTLYPC